MSYTEPPPHTDPRRTDPATEDAGRAEPAAAHHPMGTRSWLLGAIAVVIAIGVAWWIWPSQDVGPVAEDPVTVDGVAEEPLAPAPPAAAE